MNLAIPMNELGARAETHTAFDLPNERIARIAARRAFVELKMTFMRAAADIDGSLGERLRRQVRHASEPVQLWRLRAAVLAALRANHERTPVHRVELRRQLDSIFADSSFDPLAD
jgi:hypothetical protein